MTRCEGDGSGDLQTKHLTPTGMTVWKETRTRAKQRQETSAVKSEEDPALPRLASAGEVVWTEERSCFARGGCKNGMAVVENGMWVLQ